jgi:hypothetical protein
MLSVSLQAFEMLMRAITMPIDANWIFIRIITSIASNIDLNTLDALSSTCRQVRANLLQFRSQLITSTLHCENEDVHPDPEHTFRYRARAADWYFVEGGRELAGSGKFGDCARDMVGGCRRCGRVVCRVSFVLTPRGECRVLITSQNCAIKPPAPVLLRYRHRRICTACSKAPLTSLTPTPYSLNTSALSQSTCHCPNEGVWLCQPCGRGLRSADTEYESIWKWRTRYLPSLGGLGVGIGDANRGVECGRGKSCLAAREVEQETDCDAEDARVDNHSQNNTPSSSPGTPGSMHSAHGLQLGPGYARHEIEGIGGVVKRKLVRMVKVGACVPEYESEKHAAEFLVREHEGGARSWCGWCWKVIPGTKDGIATGHK